MQSQFENVQHDKVNDIYFFIVDTTYRRPHLHFDTEVAYVLAGYGTVKTQDTEYNLSAGQAIVFNSCQVHEIKSDGTMRLLIMQFNTTAFAPTYPPLVHIRFSSQPVFVDSKTKFLFYLLQCAKSYFQDLDHLPLLAHGLATLTIYELLQLIAFDIPNQSQQSKLIDEQERLGRISTYIQANYQETILLSDLASREGLSRNYFSHFFKNHFGISFQDYLDNVRCEHGRALLLTTKENLLTITILCGYSDIRTFNRAFSKRYNESPKQFRKNQLDRPFSEPAPQLMGSGDIQNFFTHKESLQILGHMLAHDHALHPLW